MNFEKFTKRTADFFDVIEYTDKAINKAIAKNPARAKEIWSCFLACKPDDRLLFNIDFWKTHIDTIIDRATKNEDLGRLTAPELVFAISEASLRSPAQPTICELAFFILNKFSPDIAEKTLGEYKPRFEGEVKMKYEKILRDFRIDRKYDYSSWDNLPAEKIAELTGEVKTLF